MDSHRLYRGACLIAAILLGALLAPAPLPAAEARQLCPPAGLWVAAAGAEGPLQAAELLAAIEDADVVLLGERHGYLEDHRWQLQVLTALHGRRPELAVGFEMFQRRHQAVLDAWGAGELSETELLRQSDWFEVWGYPSAAYLPLLHFARMQGVPLHALNVERALVSRVGQAGWEGVPEAERGGIGRPAAPSAAYRERLAEVLAKHPPLEGADEEQQLERFVAAQVFWDRAMAEALAAAVAAGQRPAVGIVGRGHAEYGHGIPRQLADLGVERVVVLLPHRAGEPCLDREPPVADALFGIAEGPWDQRLVPLRLGVGIDAHRRGLEVVEVVPEGVAAEAGIRRGDVITGVAGSAVEEPADLLLVLDRQRPGDWLPLRVWRAGEELELLVRFPAVAVTDH